MPVGYPHNSQRGRHWGSGEGLVKSCVSAARLRIVRICHKHGFLLLSHDQNLGYSWLFMHIFDEKNHEIDAQPLLAVLTTHTRVSAHTDQFRW